MHTLGKFKPLKIDFVVCELLNKIRFQTSDAHVIIIKAKSHQGMFTSLCFLYPDFTV